MLSAASAPHTSVLAWFDGGATSDIILYPVLLLVLCGAVQSVQIRSIPPGQKWPGFYFALHLLRVQGFLFCPAAHEPHTSIYSGLYHVHANYTAHATKRRTWLYRRFSCNLPHSTAADTRPTQADKMQLTPRWSVSQRRSTSSAYKRYHRHARTLYRSAQPTIIIRYIRVQGCAHRRPCQPGGLQSGTGQQSGRTRSA